MTLQGFLTETDEEVAAIISSDFEIEVTETSWVPSFDDPAITYDNLDDQVKRCKLLESCVLYVDIRNSATISAERQPQTLARMYSAFVRTMIKCARHFGGHVRNIIGDRVMVVFDKKDCFKNAVRTGILCQTVARKVIDRRIRNFDFRCGVGIDHGKMLIVKAGAIRRGSETEFYRSLVWLGRPANVASKLTDVASKPLPRGTSGQLDVLRMQAAIPSWRIPSPGSLATDYYWHRESYRDFILSLVVASGAIRHRDPYFRDIADVPPTSTTYQPKGLLVTKSVYDGYRAVIGDEAIKKEGWTTQGVVVAGYDGTVYGSDAVFTIQP